MRRSLFFADFLGTTDSYSFIERVKRRREVLEQAVEAYFMPILEEHDLYVYIVSDSLFVTCPTVQPLLHPVARLFRLFLSMRPSGQTKQLRLDLLRGAISYGEAAETAVIKNSPRVIAIPMLDDSLPRVTALEKIRKGSRVFLDARVSPSLLRGHARCLLKWRHITGKGDPKANVTEFLWPCMAYEHELAELIQSTERIRKDWLASLVTKEWLPSEYDQGLMIQMDETLKLLIRSLARFEGKRGVGNYLQSILPKTTRDQCDLKFEWGIWFQALKALCESPTYFGQGKAPVRSRLALVKKILSEEDYWDSFLAELEKPDYADFRRSVSAIER